MTREISLWSCSAAHLVGAVDGGGGQGRHDEKFKKGKVSKKVKAKIGFHLRLSNFKMTKVEKEIGLRKRSWI